ncbi:MAG: TonB-dependent receptor [Gammaproteobacteria bacterium]|nr:TonB-dependent receptor [Gammaproteobacteria bacterium]
MLSSQHQFSLLRAGFASAAGIAVAATGLLTPAPTFAQQMEEIVTTARGRAESLQDVPAAVTVIDSDTIDQKGIQRVEDFVQLVPGMTIVDSAEVADTQVNIRGINGARDAEINYALIVDGILKTNPAALNREWSNISQIEVLKGPQGALYGRNAAAGAIIMSTMKPQKELDGRIRVSGAQDDTYTVNGMIGGIANNDALTWQISGDYRDTEGFYEDVWNNGTQQAQKGVIDQAENWSLGGRLIWQPSDALSIDTKLRYGEVDAASITFNAAFHLPDLNFLNPAFGENVNDHPFQFNPNVPSFNEQESTEFSVKVDYDLGWADLVAWGLYSDVENNLGADGTSGSFGFFSNSTNPDPDCIQSSTDVGNSGFQLPPPQFVIPGDPTNSVLGPYTPLTCDGTQYQERNQEDISFEVRLRSKSDQRFRWEGGLYFLTLEREVGVNLGIDRGQGAIVRELYTTDPSNPTEQLVHDQFDTDVYAVFGQVAYDIVDNVELAFALRYDREEREVTNLVPTQSEGAVTEFINCAGTPPFDGGDPINPGLCIDPTGASADKSKNFDQWQPKVSLRWDATDRLNIFGSVGVGFKSGGFNNFGSEATVEIFFNQFLGLCDPATPGCQFPEINIDDEYREETSTSVEVGFKSQIGDRFRWEGAAYYMEVEDMQFFEFFVGTFGLLRVVGNIDEVEIAGVELSASWAATDWLSLYANGNLLESEINENRVRPDTVGNESPYTPEYTLAFGGNVQAPMTPSIDFIADLGVNSVGKTWFHTVQNQMRPSVFGLPGDLSLARRDSYTTLNLRAGIAGERWSLVVFGNNITDEQYLEEVIPAPEFPGSFIHPGTLRRWGVEATYRF